MSNRLQSRRHFKEFLVGRKTLQPFIAVVALKDGMQTWKVVSLELLQFIQKYYLGNLFANVAIMVIIFLAIAVSLATCEKNISKVKLIKKLLKIYYEQFAVEKYCHTVYRATFDRWNGF